MKDQIQVTEEIPDDVNNSGRNQTEPKTPSERSRAFRKRQAKLRRRGRLYYLTDLEHEFMTLVLEFARENPSKDLIGDLRR